MTEDYNKRRLAANKALLDAIGMIDPKDPEAVKKYEAISKLYHELNSDIKNELDKSMKADEIALEREKLERETASKAESIKVEREKIESDKATKAEAIAAERERTDKEAKSDTRKAVLDVVGKAGIAAATIFSAVAQIKMFERSTEFEKENALLTQTDQTVVRNGLTGKFFKH